VFQHKSSLSRHQKTCNRRHDECLRVAEERVDQSDVVYNQAEQQNNTLPENVDDHADKIDHLKKITSELKEVLNNNTCNNITINNNNNNNNNTFNIVINQFGKEDLTHLSGLDFDKLMYRTTLGLVQLIEYIHFRHRSDINRNVRTTEMKNEILEYFNGNRWIYGWRDDIIKNMIEKGIDLMTDHFDNEHERLQEKWSMTMFNHVEKWLYDMQDQKPCVMSPALRNIFLMICNNNHFASSVPFENFNTRRGHRRRKSI